MPDTLRMTFLYAAIKDAQGTIRAFDFKANAVLVAMTLVVANIARFGDAVVHLRAAGPAYKMVGDALSVTMFLSWNLAITSAFLTLYGRMIGASVAADGARGVFWEGSSPYQTTNEKINEIPRDEEGIVRELAFEHLKLVHIRRQKAVHANRAYLFGYLTIMSGVVLWLAGFAALKS